MTRQFSFTIAARTMPVCIAIISIFLLLWPTTFALPVFGEIQALTTKIRHHYIEQTYRAYPNCVMHIVDLVGNVYLPPPPIPIIVDDFTREEKRYRDRDIYYDQETLYSRAKSSAGGIKIQSSDCFVTLLVVEDRKMLLKFRDGFQWGRHLRIFLRQDLTLGFKAPSPEEQYYKLPPSTIIFPESTIVLYEGFNPSEPVHILHQEFSLLHGALFVDFSHIPTIVLILVDVLRGLSSPNIPLRTATYCSAYFICFYCKEHANFFVSLDIEFAIDSAERTAFEFRHKVPWVTSADYNFLSTSHLCPFTMSLAGDNRRCSDEMRNIQALAFAYINFTQPESIVVDAQIIGIPRIIIDSKIFLSTEVFAPAETFQFGLITSDGILRTASQLSDFVPMCQPFQKPVWAALVVINIALALSMTGLNPMEGGWSRTFLSSLYSLVRVLLL